MTARSERVALVTGAANGIGRAVADALAADGATVVIVDRDQTAAREAVAAIRASGGQAGYQHADLADPAQCERVVARALDEWERVDVLVNNAAILGDRVPFLELGLHDWRAVLDVNLTAAAVIGRDAARDMAGRGTGSIVNVTSIQENLPLPTYTAYVASKGAISALTRAMAVELTPLGIRVNAVAPGVVATPSMDATVAALGAAGSQEPPASLFRRFAGASEVAEVVAFLASERASFVTGSVVRVDGGRSLSRYPDSLARGAR